MDNQDIIIAPIISEKSMKDVGDSKFTFKVSIHANKRMIKKAIEDKFKVNVIGIKTAVVKGKKTRAGKRRTEILLSPWKKAIAAIRPDQKIALFDVGAK